MGVLYDTLTDLAPEHDEEMLDGYRRYEEQLATILTSAQMEAYAAYLRRTGEIRVFEEMTSEELASLPPEVQEVATAVMADTDSTMENRRVGALLGHRGEDDVAPDFGSPSIS